MAKASQLEKPTDRSLIKRLWSNYVMPHKRTMILAFVFMAILAATQAAYVFFIRYLIDFAEALSAANGTNAAETTRNFSRIIVPAVITLTAISGGTMFAQKILTNRVALQTIAGLQKDMFKSAHQADYEFFTRNMTGDLLSRFTNDVNAVTSSLMRCMTNLFKDVLTIIGLIATMLYMDPIISGLLLVIYPIAIIPIVKLSNVLRSNARDTQQHMGVLTSELDESLSAARMIKTYGLEDHEQTRVNKTIMERARLYLRMVTNHALVDPIMEIFGGLAIAGIFAFGVYRVSSGAATGGTVAAILGAVLILAPRVRAVGTLNNVVQEGLAALNRIFAVIDENPVITNSTTAKDITETKGHIRLENVSFSYTDETILDGVTLEAKPGETIALVGPSGGGKSTLINLIPRLYDVTQGRITIDGLDLRELTVESLRSHMALVSQNVTLFNNTIAYNISLGDLSANQEQIIEAAKSANAHDFITELPEGYDTIIGEDGDRLSGGQRQRIAIARALLRDAPILLLDEATSALDNESEAKVQAALDRLAKGRTSIVIAHRLSTIENADRIFVLDAGKIIESGTHKELVKSKGLYAMLNNRS